MVLSKFPATAEQRRLAAELSAEFRQFSLNLNTHHRRVSITRVASGSVSAAAGVAATGAAIAIPFTFGVSIVLTIVFGAISASAGAAASGASIVEFIIGKTKLREVDRKWKEFQATITAHLDEDAKKRLMESIAEELGDAEPGGETLGTQAVRIVARGGPAAEIAFNGVRGGKMVAAAGGVGARTAVTAGRAALVTFTTVTAVTSVALVGLSVYDIVSASIDLYKNGKAEAGAPMEQLADVLDKFAKGEILMPQDAEY